MPPLRKAPAGRRRMLSLQEAVGAGPHASLPRVLHFLFLPGEPRQCAAPACDAMVTSFHFPGRPGKERSQRKGAAGQAKNKRAAHTVRPAPTPGPLTLALTFPIHFDSPIKRISRLRTFLIYPSASAPPAYNSKYPRMAPKGPTRLFSNAHIPISPVWLRRVCEKPNSLVCIRTACA